MKNKFKLFTALLMLSLFTNSKQLKATDYNSTASDIANSLNMEDSINQESVNNVVSGYEGTNVDQSKYYSNPSAIESDSRNKARDDENAKVLQDSFYKAPEYRVNPNEKWLDKSNEATKNPESFLSLVSSQYSDCSDIENETIQKSCKTYQETTKEICTASRKIEVEKYHQYQCFKDKYPYEKNCTNNLNVACSESHYTLPPITYNNFEAFKFNYPYIDIGSGRRMGQNCSGYIYEFKFKIDSLDAVESFKIISTSVDDVIQFYINGKSVYKFPNSNSCELNATRTARPNFNLKPYLKVGENIFKARFIVGGLGNFISRLEFQYKACKTYSSNEWQESCDNIGYENDSCIIQEKTCIDANITKNIGSGVSEKRECWQEQILKECVPSGHIDYCQNLYAKISCTQSKAQCLEESDNECINYANTYKCSDNNNEVSNKVVYQGLFHDIISQYVDDSSCPSPKSCSLAKETCIDNNSKNINGLEISDKCFEYERNYDCLTINNDDCQDLDSNCSFIDEECLENNESNCINSKRNYSCNSKDADILICGSQELSSPENQDFGKAAANLLSLQEAGFDLSEDQISTFTGEGSGCEKDIINYADCCTINGWGQGVTGGSCKPEEQELAIARTEKKCVYVGTYCSEEIDLGFSSICAKETDSYCCFNSKFSRIIHEQGRPQLGISWGSPEAPNCRGFKIEDELQRLDFSKIDFSELYEELQNNATRNMPSSQEINQQIQDTVQKYYENYEEDNQ